MLLVSFKLFIASSSVSKYFFASDEVKVEAFWFAKSVKPKPSVFDWTLEVSINCSPFNPDWNCCTSKAELSVELFWSRVCPL